MPGRKYSIVYLIHAALSEVTSGGPNRQNVQSKANLPGAGGGASIATEASARSEGAEPFDAPEFQASSSCNQFGRFAAYSIGQAT